MNTNQKTSKTTTNKATTNKATTGSSGRSTASSSTSTKTTTVPQKKILSGEEWRKANARGKRNQKQESKPASMQTQGSLMPRRPKTGASKAGAGPSAGKAEKKLPLSKQPSERITIESPVSRKWVVRSVLRQLPEIRRQSGPCFTRWFEDEQRSDRNRACGYFLVVSQDTKALETAAQCVRLAIEKALDQHQERRDQFAQERDEKRELIRLERREQAILARERRERAERRGALRQDRRRGNNRMNELFEQAMARSVIIQTKQQPIPGGGDFPPLAPSPAAKKPALMAPPPRKAQPHAPSKNDDAVSSSSTSSTSSSTASTAASSTSSGWNESEFIPKTTDTTAAAAEPEEAPDAWDEPGEDTLHRFDE